MTVDKRELLMQAQITATLAAAVIGAMGRPVSTSDVEQIVRDLSFTFNPQPGLGSYESWRKAHSPDKKYT